MTLKDLLAQQPALMAEHEQHVREKLTLELAPKAATVPQLREAFPGDENAKFREDCIAEGRSIDAAKVAFGSTLAEQLKAANAKNAEQAAEIVNLKKLNGAGASASAAAGAAAGGTAGGFENCTTVEQVKTVAAARFEEKAPDAAMFVDKATYVAACVRRFKDQGGARKVG